MDERNDSVDVMAYKTRLLDVAEEPKKLLLPIEGYEKMPLVTLEEAIKPIADILPNLGPKVYVAKNNCEQLKGRLTSDLSAAIMLYTMGKSPNDQPLYYVLNSILRSDQPDRCDKLEPWFLYLKLFITALSHIPSYRGTVYRGVKLDLSEYYILGKKFVWWGFSSCTKFLGVLQSELFLGQQGVGTLFIIDCFSGKEISEYSHYEKEDEVLLVTARQFVVVSRINPKPQLWIIQVKEIEPPFPFLKMDSSISSTLEMPLEDGTNNPSAANICSKCSKTTTNDLPCNIKPEIEISLAEQLIPEDDTQMEIVEPILSKLNTNDSDSLDAVNSADTKKIQLVEDTSNPSLSPLLINSATSNQTTSNQPTTSPITGLSFLHNATTLDTVEPVPNNLPMKVMRFRNKLINEESAKIIAENIRTNVALEILYLFNNGLTDAVLYRIIQTIVDRSIVKVFITVNKITDVGAEFLAHILSDAPNAMSLLYLDKNRLTAKGVQSIVQALSRTTNSGLRTLSFTGNSSINDECIDDIIHLLNENRTLKCLYLEKCNLSEDGKQRLRTAIREKAAFSLQL
jgi:RNA-binding protein YhbY